MDSTTFLHAITFLLAPLSSHYPAQVLDALHLSLLSAFSHLDIATRPQTLLLSPTAPPPACVSFALQALQAFPAEYRVHWADWMLLLGNGNQLMLTIVAGCVQLTARNIRSGEVTNQIVWNAALQNRTPSPWGSSVRSRSSATSSTSESGSQSSRASSPDVVAVEAAENVLNDDHPVFFGGRVSSVPMVKPQQPQHSKSLSAAAPEWFPTTAARAHPAVAVAAGAARLGPVGAGSKRAPYQNHSRSSSRSSTMSSAPSLVSSSYSSASSRPIIASHSTGGSISPVPASPTPSDMSAEDTTFYLDGTKDQLAVTEYECGKVGVLTGAVMLGVPKGPKPVKVVGGARRL